MAASRYKHFLQLCEKWPVDKSKGSRDLGVHLRKKIAEGFSKGEATVVNEPECEKMYTSLQRISTDFHKRQWERSKLTNASGATAEALNETLSDEGLIELGAEGGKTWTMRLKEKLIPPKSSP